MSYILCYDLETTGLKHTTDEIVQFSGIVLDMQLNEVETINIFHATPVSDFLLKLHGKTQEFYNEVGTDKTTFISNIEAVFNKYDFKYIMGHNIKGFDNKWLIHHTNVDSNVFLNSVDTMEIEQKFLGCDNYGNMPDGSKVKRTLKESCLRHGVSFDDDAAHDGLYDCTKTLELYLAHKRENQK